MSRIDICGIPTNIDVPDDNGVIWTSKITAGWSSPTVSSQRANATGQSGVVLLEEKHQERTVEIKGWAFAPDAAAAELAFEQLSSMPALGTTGEIVYYGPTPKSLTVRQGEEPRVDEQPAGGKFHYMLTLVALSPYKRGLTERSVTIAPGATVNVVNDGNAPAVLTVAASSSGMVRVKQTVSGQVLRSKVSVASGTVFDGVAKYARSAGGVRLVGVIDNPSEWLSVPRSSSTPVKNEGSAPVVVTWFDTYA